jgi:hypothetical protein
VSIPRLAKQNRWTVVIGMRLKGIWERDAELFLQDVSHLVREIVSLEHANEGIPYEGAQSIRSGALFNGLNASEIVPAFGVLRPAFLVEILTTRRPSYLRDVTSEIVGVDFVTQERQPAVVLGVPLSGRVRVHALSLSANKLDIVGLEAMSPPATRMHRL